MEAVFKLNQVSKSYSKFEFGPVNLTIPKGFATALIGSNGAGKTTLLDLISGVSLSKSGTIDYWGEGTEIDQNDIREQIGYVSAGNYLPLNWKVNQVAYSLSLAYQGFHRDRFNALCKEFRLDTESDRKKITLEKMSDGNRMRMMLATVLARDTKVLVLDEPASPLDPVMRDELCDKFRHYLANGNGEKSILFSTHNIADMELVTDYAVFMDHGQVIEEGFVEDLKDRYWIVRGEKSSFASVRKQLLYSTSNSIGFEGICNSKGKDTLEALDVILERPTLQQLSIWLLKIARVEYEKEEISE